MRISISRNFLLRAITWQRFRDGLSSGKRLGFLENMLQFSQCGAAAALSSSSRESPGGIADNSVGGWAWLCFDLAKETAGWKALVKHASPGERARRQGRVLKLTGAAKQLPARRRTWNIILKNQSKSKIINRKKQKSRQSRWGNAMGKSR